MKLSLAGRRSAFTLVELLVVIAIIGVRVALLLPAVQAAREAARRMKCGNNLKQLGLALHNHHDAYGVFPAARHAILQGNGAVWVHSWTPKILPYIEQQAIFEKYRFDQNWDAAVAPPAPARHVPIRRYSSDPLPARTPPASPTRRHWANFVRLWPRSRPRRDCL